MSSFNASEYISCILISNENTSSGKYPILVKTTLLTGKSGVVASLPTNLSSDITSNIILYTTPYEAADRVKERRM